MSSVLETLENEESQVKKRLNQIASLIKKGASAENFEEELDRLLGTGMEDRDSTSEATWEEHYRNEEA